MAHISKLLCDQNVCQLTIKFLYTTKQSHINTSLKHWSGIYFQHFLILISINPLCAPGSEKHQMHYNFRRVLTHNTFTNCYQTSSEESRSISVLHWLIHDKQKTLINPIALRVQKGSSISKQQQLRPVCASTQSDPSRCCLHTSSIDPEESTGIQLKF